MTRDRYGWSDISGDCNCFSSKRAGDRALPLVNSRGIMFRDGKRLEGTRAGVISRSVLAELDRWRGKEPSAEAEFYVEEMREGLLDLKFAIINGSESEAEFFGEEVRLLLLGLRLRSPEP